jgi:hypothetical protein
MGLAFYVLLAPKLRDHDYYELMMLPAAATWAALGWRAIAAGSTRRARLGVAMLAAAVVVQSPWVMGALFRLDRGKTIVAERLRDLCPPDGRVLAIGPGIELPVVVHYSRREGWAVHSKTLPPDWPARIERYRSRGARFAALYFDPKATAAQRDSYRPVLASWPVVEHRAGPWARSGGRCEYFILDLRADRAVASRPHGHRR